MSFDCAGIELTRNALKEAFTLRIAMIANNFNLRLSGWEDGLTQGLDPYNRCS